MRQAIILNYHGLILILFLRISVEILMKTHKINGRLLVGFLGLRKVRLEGIKN